MYERAASFFRQSWCAPEETSSTNSGNYGNPSLAIAGGEQIDIVSTAPVPTASLCMMVAMNRALHLRFCLARGLFIELNICSPVWYTALIVINSFVRATCHNNMRVWADNMDTSKWYYLAVQEATNSHTFVYKADTYETWVALTANPDWSKYE